MESNRKLRAFILMTIIFITVFVIDWYGKINTVRLTIEDKDEVLSLEQLDNHYTGYDHNKTYFWRKTIKKTEQNRLIPFMYKTVILSETKNRLYSK